jgi:hypothetical protein
LGSYPNFSGIPQQKEKKKRNERETQASDQKPNKSQERIT